MSVACRSQPSQTLSPLPRSPTRFMPSFQSPVPISGSAVAAEREALVEPARAVLEQRGGFVGNGGLEEAVVLARREPRAFQERNHLVQDGGVAGRVDIMGGGVGEPRAVVGDPRAHALAGMRQPPVLNVAFDELPCRCAQQVLARHLRSGGGERHAVLKLIAEAVGAARLIEGRAGPDAAGERLIEQPAVQHDVHRPIGRLHLDRAEDIVPVPADLGQNGVEIGRAIARDQAPRVFRARGLAEKEDDLDGAVRWKLDGGPQRAAGIKPGPDGVGERRRAGERRGARERAVAADELPPVAGPVASGVRRRSAKATRDPKAAFHALRANIAPVTGSISVVTNGAEAVRDGPRTHSA